MNNARLEQQIQFILEIDKLKHIIRRSYLVNGQRRENTAEHSWHLAMMALLLTEHANESVNMFRVLKMVLIHDIVEIDAGDTYLYDEMGQLDKADREQKAAIRLFGFLPADQAEEFHQLWQEFEARDTPDARFANSLDRLMPLLHNYHSKGIAWHEHGITSERVSWINERIQDGSNTLAELSRQIITDAIADGYLAP